MSSVICVLLARVAFADPLTDRIAESAAAAQALQGPFDGAWVLSAGAKIGLLYRLQMTDPPNASGRVVGAWRDQDGRTGAAEITPRGTDHLDLRLDATPVVSIRLTRRGRSWTGKSDDGGLVVLTPSLATSRPPV